MQLNSQPIAEAATLYDGMGELNGSHYTNYPPLNQLCFFIAALFASKSIFGSIIVLRVLIIRADIGILYFGKKLLERLNLPDQKHFLVPLKSVCNYRNDWQSAFRTCYVIFLSLGAL